MEPWQRAAVFAGLSPDNDQIRLVHRYRQWLLDEALPAGGIGPREDERLDDRHLADSVLYARFFPHEVEELWDLGTGVGLPGVPLAILLPGTRVLLVERSRRRADLLRRALRILDLGNCIVLEKDIDRLEGKTDVVVSRASLSPGDMAPVARRHLRPGGLAVMGGSWRERPTGVEWEVVEIPSDVLDHSIWLLIMRAE